MAEFRTWHERYPARLDDESAGMHGRGFVLDATALQKGSLEFTGVLSNDWPARVIYPGAFPSKPPHLHTVDRAHLLFRHQHPVTREICTFGPHQARWNAEMNGTAVIDEAESLICSTATNEIADTVPEPASALYPYDLNCALLVPFETDFSVPSIGSVHQGLLRIRRAPRAAGCPDWRGVAVEVLVEGKKIKASSPYSEWFVGGQESKITLLVSATPPPIFAGPQDLRDYLKDLKITRSDLLALAFPEQTGSSDQTRWAWLVIQSDSTFAHKVVRTFALERREQQLRIPGLEGLRQKKVLIVGCGSIGSKIATSLAASGVVRFALVDSDYMEPLNAVRHEIGVHAFGVTKVAALAQHMIAQYGIPPAEIQLLPILIGNTNTPDQERQLASFFAEADLVIDATGNHGASHFINDQCSANATAALYVSVTNGAWSGEVVRFVPGESACWSCWLTQYENDPPPASPAGEVFAPGCDQPTFTGTTYEVGIVAHLASTVAVDIFTHRPREIVGDYLLWESRNRDGHPIFRTTVLPVQRRQSCPFCGE